MLTTQLKRIFIFDPCFGGMTGHWENYCKRLYCELIERGYQVKVFGQSAFDKKIIEGVNFEPIFRHSPYANMKELEDYEYQSDLFLNDFATIPESEFNDQDLLIFHSIFPQVLSAIAKWVKKLSAKKNIIAAIFFQFPPSETKPLPGMLTKIFKQQEIMRWVKHNNIDYYQKYSPLLAELIDSGSLILMASTDVLSKNFSALFGLKIHYIPMPGRKLVQFETDIARNTLNNQDYPEIKIGYFGHSSFEKGGQYLQYLVHRTLSIYPNAKFILHINPNPETQKFLKAFRTNVHPHVECYFGHQTQETIMQLMQKVDILLMPYCPHKYATTPSAVLTEGLPLQKVFVIPKNTWIHQEAIKYNAGYAAFKRYNPKSILKSILQALMNFDEYKTKSIKAGLAFYKENNMTNYIDMIMNIISNKTSKDRT